MISEERYAIEPQHTCSLAGAYLGVLHLEGAAIVAHASPGCGFAMRYGLAQHWKSFLPCPVTNLCEEHIIMGSENLLYKAILKTYQVYKPKQIFVLTGCSAALIQEDYESIAQNVEKNIGIPVVYVSTGGIMGDFYHGYNSFLEAIVKKCNFEKLLKPTSSKKVYISGIIPRFHMHWRGDIKELSHLLKLFFDLESLPMMFEKMSFDMLPEISDCDIYVSISSRIGKKIAKQLSKKSGCKYLLVPYAPIGIKYTSFFLREIAKLLKVDMVKFDNLLNSQIERIQGELLRGFDFAKVMYTSAKVAVIGEPSQTIPLVNFLINEIGIFPVLVAFTEFASNADLKELEEVLSVRGCPIFVLNQQDNSLIKEFIAKSGANLVFGRSLDRVSNLDIVHITWQFPASDHLVVYDRPILGFSGMVSLVDYIINGFSSKWY